MIFSRDFSFVIVFLYAIREKLVRIRFPREISVDCYSREVSSNVRQDPNKVELAKEAVEHQERLCKCGFFDVYSEFNSYRRRKHPKVASWTDGDVGFMRRATERFFKSLHDDKRGSEDSKFVCYFKERNKELGGRPTNTLAYVRIHGENTDTKYNIKCHHYGPKGTSSGNEPDIFEFYCYKLLALIGVGPKCYIIPPNMSTGSNTCAYIATQWSDDFELLQDVMAEKSLCADIVVLLVFLRTLLFIADLRGQNCGKWRGTKDVAIVDFAPTNDFFVYDDDDIKKSILKTIPHQKWRRENSDVRRQHDDISWMKIAKLYVDKWYLSNKIDLAREQLDPTKVLLKSLEICFMERKELISPTDQLNDYIDTLHKNVENLRSLLNTIVE